MPIEAKFHVEPQWNLGTKICSNGPGHMTKLATMPIYSKKHEKFFFSKTKRLMTLKACMQHQVLKCYQVYSNGDSGLTLTCFAVTDHFAHFPLCPESFRPSRFAPELFCPPLRESFHPPTPSCFTHYLMSRFAHFLN